MASSEFAVTVRSRLSTAGPAAAGEVPEIGDDDKLVNVPAVMGRVTARLAVLQIWRRGKTREGSPLAVGAVSLLFMGLFPGTHGRLSPALTSF